MIETSSTVPQSPSPLSTVGTPGRARFFGRFPVPFPVRVLVGVATSLSLAGASVSAAQSAPAFSTPLEWARWIVQDLRPENNQYGTSPSYVNIANTEANTETSARTMCNSFVSSMFSLSYGFNESFFRFWTGSRSPTAGRYAEMLTAGKLLRPVGHINDVRPGDLLVIDYGDPTASSTGHLAFIDALPTVRYPQSAPFVTDTIQYEVLVIDSARTGHGPSDTRRMSDGTWASGVGRGTMRLYVNAVGSVVGYAWSTYTSSSYAVNGQGSTTTRIARFSLP